MSLANRDDHSYQSQHGHTSLMPPGQWEGSAEGIAYSEFNHALAGLGVILVGLTELHTAIGWTVMVWLRWLLPVALVGSGILLLIWSDHEAWPIGTWTLVETLSGKDPEILQHKIFGMLALGVGTVEWLRQAGRVGQWFWSAFLPGFALIGGGMLFWHMHGPHPAGHQIQIHHTVMGTLALAGGLAWFAGEWVNRPLGSQSHNRPSKSILKIIWAILVIVIGVQLLFYSET
jgi:putative copper resistance protein D